LPAIESADGSKSWWVNDKRHRDGGLPAIELADGTREWWFNDERHRDGGLPAIDYSIGHKEWWVNGQKLVQPKKEYPKRPRGMFVIFTMMDVSFVLTLHGCQLDSTEGSCFVWNASMPGGKFQGLIR